MRHAAEMLRETGRAVPYVLRGKKAAPGKTRRKKRRHDKICKRDLTSWRQYVNIINDLRE
jgi:hypothetical protein